MTTKRRMLLSIVALFVGLASGVTAQDPPSEETINFFKVNCSSCHTIGGGALAGPDLKGVTERKDSDWLARFILDPKGVIDSGDAYARTLVDAARGAVMPTLPGIDKTLAGKLVDLMKAESALPKSRFAGVVISDRPLTAADVERGRRLFTGTDSFKSRAPACNGCHSVRDLEGFGGGTLGPDLTGVFSRLEGRKPLGAWLSAPPSPVMRPVFSKAPLEADEILPLVAFFQSQAAGGDAPIDKPPSLEFVLAGIGGAAVLFVLMDYLWRNRYRAVRRSLVMKS